MLGSCRQLSVICLPFAVDVRAGAIVRHAIQTPTPSPWLHDGRQLGLRHPEVAGPHLDAGGRHFAGIVLGERPTVAVLSPTADPLAVAIVAAIGPGAALLVPGDASELAPVAGGGVVVLCAVGDAAGPPGVFEATCAAAGQCVTICR